MSLIATAAAASAASPTVNLFTHGHKKGSHAGAKDGTASSSTQGPATTQSLLSSLFESIEQVMGISLTAPPRAVSATTPAAGAVTAAAGAGASATAGAAVSATGASAAAMSPTATPSATAAAAAAPGSAQDVQSFLHSLFQALKTDGLGGSAGATGNAAVVAGAGAGAAAGATSGAGRYDGSLVSSLQTLIQQVDSNGPATAATSNLSASFNKLMQGGGGSTAAPQASLQNFLGNLLQNVQSNGVHSIGAMGANINAKV